MALAQGGDPWKMQQAGGRPLVQRVAELKVGGWLWQGSRHCVSIRRRAEASP